MLSLYNLMAKRPAPYGSMFVLMSALSLNLTLLAIGQQHTSAKPANKRQTQASAKSRRAGRVNGTDYPDVALYEYWKRAFPFDTIDNSAYAEAVKHRDQMPPAQWNTGSSFHANIAGGSWQFVGPNNLSVPYRPDFGLTNTILNGRINAIAFDPFVPTTYYQASATGGFFRSTDSGVTWNSLSDTWPVLQTSSIVIDPTNNKIIYVGTGDFDGFGNYATGIMKTTDGGMNWTNLGKKEFGNCAIRAMVLSPLDPNVLIVAPGRGPGKKSTIWRSEDGGATFTAATDDMGMPLPKAAWSSLAFSADGMNLYACSGDGTLWVSQDTGISWKMAQPTDPVTSPVPMTFDRLTTSPTKPGTLYVIDATSMLIWQSDDLGATWKDITGNFPSGGGMNWLSPSYDSHIECSIRNGKDVIYVGLIDLAQSLDGGASWRSIGGPTYDTYSVLHDSQHCLTVSPFDPSQALVGNDGGAYLLTNSTSQPTYQSWSYKPLNNVGGAMQYFQIALHPTDPTHILGGADGNATSLANGDLANWKSVGIITGGWCAIRDNATQFATTYFGTIYRTSNSWSNFFDITPIYGGNDIVNLLNPIVLDPTGNYLYAGSNYLYRYTIVAPPSNPGTQGTWANRLGNVPLTSAGTIQAIAVAPNNTNRIYTGADDGSLYSSADFGATWKSIKTGSPNLPVRSITSLAVLPDAPNSTAVGATLLVGFSGTGAASGFSSGHLYRSADISIGSRFWTNVSGTGATGLPNIPLNAIALDPDSPATTWYVATDVGVFMTTNSGTTWANLTAPLGLPNAQINDLKVQAATRSLYAGTYGRGIWKITIPGTVRSMAGTISLDGIPSQSLVSPGAPIGPITFTFRPVGGGASFVRQTTLSSTGGYSLSNLPAGSYTVGIKGRKWLQIVAAVDVTTSDVTNVSVKLEPGDANDDNMTDLTDFGLFINSYGLVYDPLFPADYDGRVDFNGDGVVDFGDFGLLVNTFGTAGDP